MTVVKHALTFAQAAIYIEPDAARLNPERCRLPECGRRLPMKRREYCCHDHRMQHLKMGRWKEPGRCL